jgi:hypothetical protein
MMIKWLALAGMSLVMSLDLAGCNKSAAPPAPAPAQPSRRFDAHDSPVTVEGGSIHAQGTNTPAKVDKDITHYTTTTTNFDQLYINGVVNWTTTAPPVPAPFPDPIQGWTKITIATDQIPNAVTITHDPPPSCTAANCTIHLQTDAKSRWHLNKRNQLRYHNGDNKCDGPGEGGKGEDSDCDFFSNVSVTYDDGTGTKTVTGTCNDPEYGQGYCMLGIGKK